MTTLNVLTTISVIMVVLLYGLNMFQFLRKEEIEFGTDYWDDIADFFCQTFSESKRDS